MELKTYHVITYGCQMNNADSERMAGILEARGMREVNNENDADLILVNTCIVRASAEDRAAGHINRIKGVRKVRPHALIGVCGCLAQRDAQDLFAKFPHIDFALGTRAISALSAVLDRLLNGEHAIAITEECADLDISEATPHRSDPLRAMVPIMIGCNNWCSYCIVPKVRGPEKSRPADVIVREVESLVAEGCREIMLVGQNVNSYHDGDVDFASLLEKVHAIKDLWRIRYITSHPRDANARHLDALARLSDKVCDHIHLPVQSGSTRILKLMNRGYTREDYLHTVDEIRKRMPNATLTTDIIVGFPGETEKEFQETVSLVEQVRFDAAFTFFYNVRTGTKAAEMPDDVSIAQKKERLARLIEIQERLSLEVNQKSVGRELDLLVQGPARRTREDLSGTQMMGRTTGDKCVIYDGSPDDAGKIIRVRVTSAMAHTLFGEVVSRKSN